jgi:pimeloyl-ACP methyl ester carboxylesterase
LYSTSLFEGQFFRDFPKGHRYGLWVLPKELPLIGTILCIQTPGEENNFARRVLVQSAHRLADRGYATLIFDPYGVGDSAGKTSDARLLDWRSDLMRISHQMRLKYDVPFYIWGIRLGTLLAADLFISQSDTTAGLLLWAPLAHGRTWVDHLKRSASVSNLVSKPFSNNERRKETRIAQTQASLINPPSLIACTSNDTIDHLKQLGGSSYRASLIEEINSLSLAPTKQQQSYGNTARIGLFGVINPNTSRNNPKRKSPALEAIESNWKAAGFEVHAEAVASENFWSSMTPYDPILLYEASEAWLSTIKVRGDTA